ncbi:restriction endonuclease subunit S [Mycolicibacterium brisbanense]|nr:restriction endonuclease subunit S [Mycolicibacterium brisbanense]
MVSFLEALGDATGGNHKVPRSEYRQLGQLPVVDQGKALISGYTNDNSLAFRHHGPNIIFGDHTRTIKYIDFPFAMGADGVKVLRARGGFDPKFLYHYLCTVSLPDAGYSRHFKFLKEIQVPKPPLDEQRRIAAILDQADSLRTKRRQVLAGFDELSQAVFHATFGDPITNERNFRVRRLQDWIDPNRPITYGILKPGPDVDNGVPYVRVADMKNGGIDEQAMRRTSPAISDQYKRSLLQQGDLLMSIRGHVGRFASVPESLAGANITQDSARLAIAEPASATYVRAAMEMPSFQHWMARRTKGAAVQGINLGDVKEAPIPSPPLQLQRNFAAVLSSIRSQIDRSRAQLVDVDTVFASLQSRAFRGEL